MRKGFALPLLIVLFLVASLIGTSAYIYLRNKSKTSQTAQINVVKPVSSPLSQVDKACENAIRSVPYANPEQKIQEQCYHNFSTSTLSESQLDELCKSTKNSYSEAEWANYKYCYISKTSYPPHMTGPVSDDETKTYFMTNIYPKYPDLQKQIATNNIKRIFKFKLTDEIRGDGGFLMEVEKTVKSDKSYSFYIVTAKVQKELINPMSGYADPNGVFCSLNNFLTSKDDKSGDLILSGRCGGYGGGMFTSIYKISNGEKVSLTGNVDISGTTYKGMSPTGNALGKVRGAFGYNNPTLVVEFGPDDESAATNLERLSSIGFFDLQTGNLKQLVKFN